MSKNTKLTHLIEQEKLLYLEIEQLRYTLYLHDGSIVFQFLSVFYFVMQGIKKNFARKEKECSLDETKNKSIASLLHKKRAFLFLSKTPYAWIIFGIRNMTQVLLFRRNSTKFDTVKSLGKKSFLIFGSTYANDLQSRSVQIARKLAEKHYVMYIEGVFDIGKNTGFRIIEESGQFKAIRLTAYKSFHLNYQKPSQKEILLIKQSFKLINLLTRSLVNPLTYVHHPFWASIIALKRNTFYFDHANDFVHLHTAVKHIITFEKKLLKDALVVTSPHSKLRKNKGNIIIKNGVDWNLFKNTSKMIQTCDVGLCWIKKPVMGYIGTLDERVDESLLGSIATAFPTASIVLVGNTDYRPVIEIAEQYQNIFPVGKQHYKKLPLFLQSFDILIVPFKYSKNAIIDYPELPLYLSSGKPIVASSATDTAANGLIYRAKTHADWMRSIAEALKEKPRSKKKYFRIAVAKKLVWKSPKFS